MRQRLVLLVTLVIFVGGGLVWFINQPETCSTAIPVEEDRQLASAFSSAFETPQWEMMYEDHGSSISVGWFDESGLAHVDYLRYNCGLSSADLDNYGFDISLGGYDSWERTAECAADDLRLHQFDVVYNGGENYKVRFWLQPVNATRLLALQLSFPAERQADMETYAARLFPDLSDCM